MLPGIWEGSISSGPGHLAKLRDVSHDVKLWREPKDRCWSWFGRMNPAQFLENHLPFADSVVFICKNCLILTATPKFIDTVIR